MNRIKEFKYFALVMLLFGFIAAGSLSSCRDDRKKKENTEQQSNAQEEHPNQEEEHPNEEGEEHPNEGGEEHPNQ